MVANWQTELVLGYRAKDDITDGMFLEMLFSLSQIEQTGSKTFP